MLAKTASVYKLGTSRGIVLPAFLPHRDKVGIAVNRLMVVDPLGEVPEDVLLEVLVRVLEPELRRRMAELETQDGER